MASLLLLFPLLAGCSSNDAALPIAASATHGTGSLALSLNRTLNATVLVQVNTLHLLAAPLTNFTAPMGNETVIATKNGLTGSEYYLWNITVHQPAVLTGLRTSLLLRLTQSAAQSGGNNDPGCTATLTLIVRSNGTDTGYVGGCGSAGLGMLGPGDHRIEFASPPGAVPAVHVGPGDGIFLQVGLHFAGSTLGPSGFLMGGNSTTDSWVRVNGLRETVVAPAPPA